MPAREFVWSSAVSGFVDEPTSPVIYVAAEQLPALAPSGIMLKLTPGVDGEAKRKAVTQLPGVSAYLSTESLSTTVRKAFNFYNVLVALALVVRWRDGRSTAVQHDVGQCQ